MTIDEALDVLADIHTSDDRKTGFSVRMGAKPEYWNDRARYVEAWKVVREFVKKPTEPGHYPSDDT